MKDNFINKLSEDLLKSGIGSEMKVLKILRNQGWSASGLANYQDLDSNSTRESDIVAHYVLAESKDNNDMDILYQAFYGLSIEVKKSNKPWIVLKEEPSLNMDLFENYKSMLFTDGPNPKFRRGIFYTLGRTSLANKIGWFGNGVHEAFKNPEQPSRWYSSFISVCKAAEHSFKENIWQIEKDEETNHWPYLWYQKPILVLDGELFSAELDNNNEINISPIDNCSVKFQFVTAHYNREEYVIDIVRLTAFHDYLDFSTERLTQLKDSLLKITKKKT